MILGPFTGEPGYELLYWIPYLRWRLGDKFKDCTAITRGGAGVWYPCKTIDAYDLVSGEEYVKGLNLRTSKRNTFKSDSPTKDYLDRLILERAGLQSSIHPSEAIVINVRHIVDRAGQWPIERLPKPPRLENLPDKYTAVRFYKGKTFNSQYVPKITKRLMRDARKQGTVVYLHMAEPADDHEEITEVSADVVVKYGPRESLTTVSRVVAHADNFVCTYGGLSYLGPLYGVPTLAVLDNPGYQDSMHCEQEDRMIDKCGSRYTRVLTKI